MGFQYDPVGNLTQLTPVASTTPLVKFDYDTLSRLTAFKDGPTNVAIESYAYDATGNRQSFTNAAGTQAYTYPSTRHRLSQVGATARTYDNAGNTTAIGGLAKEFVYDDTGRMSQVKQNAIVQLSYAYNSKGEQVRKHQGTVNTYTVFDEAGHWLGDYDNTGTALQQAIWLDDLPVGLIANGNQLHYIEPDHLGTPRVVIEVARNVPVWTWDLKSEAFGNSVPSQNPDLDANQFVFDMRFPGQRYDAASGLNYNYLRDGYEPPTGRYTQSDPIGLGGGISTYGYVGGNPLANIDPTGLACVSKNGFTYCAYPNGPIFKVPTQPGWKDFNGSELLYHHYDILRKIGCADPERVMRELINHPTPSENARPATTGGTERNDASVPLLPVSNFVTTYLTTDLRNGNSMIVNMTAAGSFFDPGYVARTVTNGVAHTYGEGLSPVQVDKAPSGAIANWVINELVWGRQMQQFIDKCGCN